MLLKMTIDLIILKKPYIDVQIVFLALLEVTETQKRQKFTAFRKFTLKYDPLTSKMTSGAVENDTMELTNPHVDPEIISLSLLEVTSPGLKSILQTQVTNTEHGRL